MQRKIKSLFSIPCTAIFEGALPLGKSTISDRLFYW